MGLECNQPASLRELRELSAESLFEYEPLSEYIRAEQTLSKIAFPLEGYDKVDDLVGEIPELHLLAKRALVVAVYLGLGGEDLDLDPYLIRDPAQYFVESVTTEIDSLFEKTVTDYVSEQGLTFTVIDPEGANRPQTIGGQNIARLLTSLEPSWLIHLPDGLYKTICEDWEDQLTTGEDKAKLRAGKSLFRLLDFSFFSKLSLNKFWVSLYEAVNGQGQSPSKTQEIFKALAMTVFSEAQLQALRNLQLRVYNTPEAKTNLRLGTIDGQREKLYAVNDLYLQIARILGEI